MLWSYQGISYGYDQYLGVIITASLLRPHHCSITAVMNVTKFTIYFKCIIYHNSQILNDEWTKDFKTPQVSDAHISFESWTLSLENWQVQNYEVFVTPSCHEKISNMVFLIISLYSIHQRLGMKTILDSLITRMTSKRKEITQRGTQYKFLQEFSLNNRYHMADNLQ